MQTFSLGQRLLCIDTLSDRLWLTNDIGQRILAEHLTGHTHELIARRLAADYDVEFTQALNDVATCIDEGESSGVNSGSIAAINRHYIEPNRNFLPKTALDLPLLLTLHLPGLVISVRSDVPELKTHLQQLYRLPLIHSDLVRRVEVLIYRDHDTLPIVINGEVCDAGASLEDVIVKLHRELTVVALERQTNSIVLHAAAVTTEGQGVLMPALGGSGKTTLTAWLLLQGFQLLNDDLLGLSADTHQLNTAPMALSVKSGAWPVICELYTDFSELPVYGPPGHQFRYLPPSVSMVASQPASVRLVVIPAYDATADNIEVTSLTADQLFEHLVESGSLILRPFVADKIESLVRWLNNVDTVRVRYAALADVERFIRARLQG